MTTLILTTVIIVLAVIVIKQYTTMKLDKARLVQALKVAVDSKNQLDAVKQADAEKQVQIDNLTEENAGLKEADSIVNDAEVQGLVDQIVGPVAPEGEQQKLDANGQPVLDADGKPVFEKMPVGEHGVVSPVSAGSNSVGPTA